MFRPISEAPSPPGTRVFKMELQCFNGEADRPHSEEMLQLALDFLVAANVAYFRAYPNKLPPLYKAGVVYTREALGADERWQDAPTTYLRKRGDCEDLASWRAAELQCRGIPARSFASGRRLPSGQSIYHIRVQTQRGIEDPSRVLGMLSLAEGEVGYKAALSAPLAWVPTAGRLAVEPQLPAAILRACGGKPRDYNGPAADPTVAGQSHGFGGNHPGRR